MANLSSANVTVIEWWYSGGVNGRRNVVKVCKYTGTTAGGASNQLVASAFGLARVNRCSNIFLDSSTKKVYPAAPSTDGSYIGVTAPTQGTDANRADLADLATSTDYAYITVEGPPSLS
jgi:hypothetical protein